MKTPTAKGTLVRAFSSIHTGEEAARDGGHKARRPLAATLREAERGAREEPNPQRERNPHAKASP